jgi:threonine/homoserine/homoserine lactone efflux protein
VKRLASLGDMSERILAFTVLAALLTITPGIDMALVTRNAIRGGLGEALTTSAGILTGVFVWALAAVVGVAAVLASSATAYTAIKLAGAAYLIYLGLKALLGGHTEVSTRGGTPFRQGLVSNLLNPKIAVFYSSVIPQFVVADDPVFLPALLAGIHLATGIVLVAGLCLVGDASRERFAAAACRAHACPPERCRTRWARRSVGVRAPLDHKTLTG